MILGFEEKDLKKLCEFSADEDNEGDWWGHDTNIGDLPSDIKKFCDVPVVSVERLKWICNEFKKTSEARLHDMNAGTSTGDYHPLFLQGMIKMAECILDVISEEVKK